jgi:hypothetical protein
MTTAFGKDESSTCAACFSGRYPVAFDEPMEQPMLFTSAAEELSTPRDEDPAPQPARPAPEPVPEPAPAADPAVAAEAGAVRAV